MKHKNCSLIAILLKAIKIGSIIFFTVAMIQVLSLISTINTYIKLNINENIVELVLVSIIGPASIILTSLTLLLIYQNRKNIIHLFYNYRKSESRK